MSEETINLADLPDDLREQVVASRQRAVEKLGIQPVGPRLYQAHFQTKEQREYGEKLDELIDQHNLVAAELMKWKESR